MLDPSLPVHLIDVRGCGVEPDATAEIFLASLNLTYNDKMSMASSVEVVCLFWIRELAEFVAWERTAAIERSRDSSAPPLNTSFARRCRTFSPASFCDSRKPLAQPVDYWLANDLKEMVDDLLSESRVRERDCFVTRVRKLWKSIAPVRRIGRCRIWQFLTLELWMQTFLDGGSKQIAAI